MLKQSDPKRFPLPAPPPRRANVDYDSRHATRRRPLDHYHEAARWPPGLVVPRSAQF